MGRDEALTNYCFSYAVFVLLFIFQGWLNVGSIHDATMIGITTMFIVPNIFFFAGYSAGSRAVAVVEYKNNEEYLI